MVSKYMGRNRSRQDNARSLYQLSSYQINPPANKHLHIPSRLTQHLFLCVLMRVSQIFSVASWSWLEGLGGRVMWNVISLQQGWEWEPHFVMFYWWQTDKWDRERSFSLLPTFYILRIDKQWNEWDKIWRFLDALKFDPGLAGSECAQWTMNHDPRPGLQSLQSRGSKFML